MTGDLDKHEQPAMRMEEARQIAEAIGARSFTLITPTKRWACEWVDIGQGSWRIVEGEAPLKFTDLLDNLGRSEISVMPGHAKGSG